MTVRAICRASFGEEFSVVSAMLPPTGSTAILGELLPSPPGKCTPR